nr:3beta-hydroxysteroid-dehydrogenase/ decarboxylase isoform X1 [Ipomoea batatas]
MATDQDGLKTCVVLGGRSFVGRSLVGRLLRLGNWIVRVADSAISPELDASDSESDSLLSQALSSGLASYHRVDVRDKFQITKAIEGVSVVFYMDTMDSHPPDLLFCYAIIVQGAKNVISVCQECKVKRLIYNSRADVVFEKGLDIENGDESLPFAGKFENMFIDLKAQAEALILVANNVDGLLTCSLRPSYVFGPGDKQLLPMVVKMAKSWWAKFIIGRGDNRLDFTYVENLAHAHICAEEALTSKTTLVSGKAFFINNLEPMTLSLFTSLVLEGLGYQRPMLRLPSSVMKSILSHVKSIHLKINSGKLDDYATVYNFFDLALCSRTFNCSASQKYLRYSRIVPMEEAITTTVRLSPHLAKDSFFSRYTDYDEESKVHKRLGGGKVAEVLLWRDEKITFAHFLLWFLIYYWFFLSGRTFVSSLAILLLLIATMLCGYSVLPPVVYGITVPRISWSCFEISEVDMRICVTTIGNMWNRMNHGTRLLAQGEDWCTFLKVAGLLYCLKLIVSLSLTAILGVALVLVFLVFFIYEQYEEEVDGVAKVLFSCGMSALSFLSRNSPMPLASILSNFEMSLKRKDLD